MRVTKLVRLALSLFASAVLLTMSLNPPAFADGGFCGRISGSCKVEASRSPSSPKRATNAPQQSAGSGRSTSKSPSTRSNSAAVDATRRLYIATRLAEYRVRNLTYSRCLNRNEVDGTDNPCSPPSITINDGFNLSEGGSNPAVPLITPAQAGAIAVARLQLPLNTPGIGPDPQVNQWKMAAVGYPLWLWAEGPTSVGPVGQTVAGLSVSLRAEVARTTFRTGDGDVVRCAGAGTPYRSSVTPGTKSPTCGHIYTKASLPRGNYTVTAVTTWAVTWTAGGQSGVIEVPRATSAELRVGELQSLVR